MSHDPSEIILICSFAAQKIFIISVVLNIFFGNHDDLLFFWNYQNNLFKTWNFYNNINVLIICFHQFLLTLNFLIVVYVIFKYFYLAVSFCAYVTNSSAEGEF